MVAAIASRTAARDGGDEQGILQDARPRHARLCSPGRVTRPDGRLPVVLYALGGETDLLGSLRGILDAGGTGAQQVHIVDELWARTRPLRSLAELPLPMDGLDAWLATPREAIPSADAIGAITSALGSAPKEIRNGADFRASARLIADQLLAAAIGGRPRAFVPPLMQAARLLGFIDRVSANAVSSFTAQDLLSRPVLIPPVAVPWPVTTASKDAYKARWEAAHRQRRATTHELTQSQRIDAAVADVSAAIRAGGAAPAPAAAAPPPRARGDLVAFTLDQHVGSRSHGVRHHPRVWWPDVGMSTGGMESWETCR